jgi:hypothetical protein
MVRAGLAFDRDGSDEQAQGPTSSIKKLHHRLAATVVLLSHAPI